MTIPACVLTFVILPLSIAIVMALVVAVKIKMLRRPAIAVIAILMTIMMSSVNFDGTGFHVRVISCDQATALALCGPK